MQTYAYGFPRLGKEREYKKAIESFWSGKITEDELKERVDNVDRWRLAIYEKYVDKFPVGEMTFYDNMLDTALIFGLYKWKNLEDYFNLCRGKNALEMTKWFNTNYHYLVPIIDSSFSPSGFNLSWDKLKQAEERHKKGVPYLIGPFTFLKLSKGINSQRFKDYLFALADTYKKIIDSVDEIYLDEPAFVMELSQEEITFIKEAYKRMSHRPDKIYLFTYYDSVDFLKDLYGLPVKAIGLDFVNGEENLRNIKKYGFPKEKLLIAGIVDGRNVWRTEIRKSLNVLDEIAKYTENLAISNASPLYHLPVTKKGENLDEKLLEKLAFAEERLEELKLIAKVYNSKEKKDIEKYDKVSINNFGVDWEVQERIKILKEKDFIKEISYNERNKTQRKVLNLPLFPTTTIGSFPQTSEVRRKRRDFRRGELNIDEYKSFIREEIVKLVKFQEDLGIDVLVHGEFERTDMVEFFAQKLEGIATTCNGWIISYGTRVYRPPLIYGDVSRNKPMTLEEITFAQGLTKKPVKGMLTGPVTIIAWSFVRKDVPISDVSYQIALCLQEEIKDYEKEKIQIVQIDEPAFREKAPIKKRNWDKYFEWAVKSFNLASKSNPELQIHTHMCYSEFGEIIGKINQLNFDVISIEASRSKGDILKYFKNANFNRQIGLGIWDIHSPRIPTIEEMIIIIKRALKTFPKENFWINPDCGLKTREWEETISSLKNMVKGAKRLREEFRNI